MGAAFDEEGKEGAISRIVFDTWYPGYMTQVVDSHNIISILTETALYRYATPHFYTVRDFPKSYQDLTMSAFYPSPWRGGWWRLNDAVDYCLTASMAVLDVASKYRAGASVQQVSGWAGTSSSRFRKEPPYAWIIPGQAGRPRVRGSSAQPDDPSGGRRLPSEEPFACDGITYPAGTYRHSREPAVRPIPQERLRGAELSRPEEIPRPLAGARAVPEVRGRAVRILRHDGLDPPLPIRNDRRPRPNSAIGPDIPPSQAVLVRGRRPGIRRLRLSHWPEANNSLTAAARLLQSREPGWCGPRVRSPSRAQVIRPERSLVPSGRSAGRSDMSRLAADLGVTIAACPGLPKVETMVLKTPRLAVYQSWVPSEDEGWTRLILEQYEIPFTVLHDGDVKAGHLKANYDALIIPDHWTAELITDGFPKGMVPPPYTGGLTANGLRNLKKFAEEGGTLDLPELRLQRRPELVRPARAQRAQERQAGGIRLRGFDPAPGGRRLPSRRLRPDRGDRRGLFPKLRLRNPAFL